jgi:EAL domain-containing protein (putative c-di-GMP-specific phosphodiesterase class I)
LRLEITETVMMTEMEKRLQILDELRSMGFLVEMDDFGSGYSSLNMLKDMPVDLLKIDMMFLYKTKDTRKAQLILQNIINLSGDLGIPSLTEGVETRDQRDMLLSMGCKMFQGYYFAKPMPLEDFEAFYGSAA